MQCSFRMCRNEASRRITHTLKWIYKGDSDIPCCSPPPEDTISNITSIQPRHARILCAGAVATHKLTVPEASTLSTMAMRSQSGSPDNPEAYRSEKEAPRRQSPIIKTTCSNTKHEPNLNHIGDVTDKNKKHKKERNQTVSRPMTSCNSNHLRGILHPPTLHTMPQWRSSSDQGLNTQILSTEDQMQCLTDMR